MDDVLARAGIFQGVEPSAVAALTKQLQPVDFPRGHVIFNEGEPGDRLYIIVSGKVKIEVNQTYALKDAAQAQIDLVARKTTGSTVLLP